MIGITFAILLALAVACSGAGAAPQSPTLTPTPAPTPTPTLEPTPTLAFTSTPTPATPRATGLLVNEPGSFEGYTLYANDAVYLVDHLGRLIHAWEPSGQSVGLAKLLDNGNLLTDQNREIGPGGNVVWAYRHPQYHDLLKLPNGNVLILSREFISREEAIAIGFNPDNLLHPEIESTLIVEVRPTGPTDGEVVWRWSALDHLIQDFDPKKPNYGAVADHPERIDANFIVASAIQFSGRADWLHTNALDYNAELDQIMITVRHFSEIWIIDRSTSIEEAAGRTGGNAGRGGDLLYRWGNPRAYQRGTVADQRLFWPHNAHWIPDGSPGAGNVLIFNNGNEYRGFKRRRSSVDEVALPADGYNYRLAEGAAYGPDDLVWTYAADPPGSFYAPTRSGAQRLPNGATLIADGVDGRIFEVTREGETVWEFAPPRANELYRAYRYAPDHPGILGILGFYRAVYRAAAEDSPVVRSAFDLYLMDGGLAYVKERCDESDTEHPFFLHIAPERAEDLRQGRRRGFDDHPADFFVHGALFDDKCVMRVPLPDYPVAAVRTGQRSAEGGAGGWSASFRLNPEPQRAAYRVATASEPVARSVFNLYVLDDRLVYTQERCDQEDARDRFFLHIVPERAEDLPRNRREFRFDNLDFNFFLHGALFAGRCVATVPLPDYPIASVRTGQFGPQGELWSAEFAVG